MLHVHTPTRLTLLGVNANLECRQYLWCRVPTLLMAPKLLGVGTELVGWLCPSGRFDGGQQATSGDKEERQPIATVSAYGL